MFISHFEVIDSKSGSVVFQTTLWDALGDTIAFSFAPPLDENHPDGSRAPPPPSIGNLRWRRFRGDGDRTGRESLELRQPSLPVKNRTLRSQ